MMEVTHDLNYILKPTEIAFLYYIYSYIDYYIQKKCYY